MAQQSMDVIDIVKLLGMVVILGAIFVFVADKTVTATALTTANVSATGTFTFTNNSTTGEFVNITNATGETMCFYINTTGTGKPVGCLVVRVDGTTYSNTSSGSASSLKAAMNNDSDINGSMVASNTTINNVVITWDSTAGSAGNSIITTSTTANGSWAAGTLTGGKNASVMAGMQANILSSAQTGSAFIVVLLIAIIGGTALAYMSLFSRKRGD